MAEQFKAFVKAVETDAVLQKKLKGAGDVDAVVAIAKEAGFAISAENLKNSQTELSDAELESVAGGFLGNITNGTFCDVVRVTILHGVNGCIGK